MKFNEIRCWDGYKKQGTKKGTGKNKGKRVNNCVKEDGRIVKGVNTTADVGVNQTKIEAAKFGNTVTKDGVPPTLSKQVKGKSTNVLFNLGLSEGYKLKLERDKDIDVLHILDTNTKKRIEVRGKKGYEGNGYDAQDKLHQVLDSIGRAANISELMNGEVVGINPKHPKGADAEKTAKDILTTESLDNIYESVLYYRQMKENLGEIAEATEIYIDMDGVLADFFGEWAKLMDKDHWTKINDFPDALQKIRDTEKFWLDLPILPQAKQLLALIKQVKGEYNICSTPLADDPKSEPHKREWIKKNLAFFPPKNIHITHNKPQYATQSDGTPNILIDDYGKNVNEWESAGGIGFKYKDHKFERTAKDIKQHMQEPVEENISEAKSADLYHSTHDDESFVGILKSGAIKPNFDHEHTTEKDPRPYISLSRDKKFDMFGSLPITLVIDQTKLANSHKITPYDSFAGDDDFDKRSSGSSEAEERVYKPIPISYIKYVILRNANWIDSEAVLAAAKAANIPVVDLNGQPIKENFADGKKPGRKGLAKRSGINTKASVSSLRKTAKRSSGEKQRMAHWLANMKAGRAKKK
jgi:5'(3')-deoxyribonucleotidase